jgi:hypothetical protein
VLLLRSYEHSFIHNYTHSQLYTKLSHESRCARLICSSCVLNEVYTSQQTTLQ